MTDRLPDDRMQTKNRPVHRISPKNQILLIALGFFVFNLVLIAIWAWVLFGR